MLEILQDIVTQTWLITAQMAPYLLLGFLMAGLLSVFISPAWLERHLGGRGPGPVIKAALLGIPLPLCSCGVLPVGASLRQHGAGRSATTAFLLSTPQTGVDSILVTWTMLGPFFALFRPLAALVTGLAGGGAVQVLAPDEHHMVADRSVPDTRPTGLGRRLTAALSYGLEILPGDIGRALVIGLVLAGILGAVVPASFLDHYLGGGALAVLAMMMVGIPLYVCATGSVPIAAGFIHMGASPGAALAFLIAGPATNVAALTTVDRILGRRAAAVYLLTAAGSAFGCGMALDWLLPRASLAIPFLGGVPHAHESVGWGSQLGAVCLVLVLGWSWLRRRRGTECCDGACEASNSAVQEHRLTITGMHCSHCALSVDRALSEIPGVESCEVVLEGGLAIVKGSGLDGASLAAEVHKLGYEAVPVTAG